MSPRRSVDSAKFARRPFLFCARNNGSIRRTGSFRTQVALLLLVMGAGLVLAPAMDGFGFASGAGTRVHAFFESIETVASSDCATAKTEWDLGQTACARVTGAIGERRIVWVAPDGNVADVSPSFSESGSDTYFLVTEGPFAQYGTWRVLSMDNGGASFAVASFLVRPENVASADLAVLKFGPLQAIANNSISYTIQVTNRGPDAAQNVTINETAPNDSTFVSELQNSGPTADCTNPAPGNTGVSTCVIPTLDVDETATFTFVYNVDPGVLVETLIVNTATVSSSTNELFQGDNLATYQTAVVGTPPPPQCVVNCPSDISRDNDPDLCSAVVTYPTPTTSGNCTDPETGETAPVVCSPPSGSVFPIGATTVFCSAGGVGCSFTVTINDTRPPVQPTIVCPADVVVSEEFEGAGSAIVSYPAPTATGNCVTVACEPASGIAFPIGTTTVTCTVTDSSSNTASCEFRVIVTGSGCTIICPPDVEVPNDSGQCSAVVTYPAPTTTGSCGAVTCTPASGSVFPVGSTQVTCTEAGGQSCSFTVTVTSGQLTALGDANVWIGLKNSDDVGTKFDLLAEVFKNGAPLASGQIDDVPGGSSGFNNAHLRTISLVLADAESVCPGDTLSFRLSVRIAASSGHVSGTARLWYNDSAANSRLSATVNGATNNYFLLNGFVLNTSAGSGPKLKSDVLVNRNVGGNPFKPFGTWTKTF